MSPEQIDLTIPLDGLDLDDLLREWRWLVPLTHKPVQMTKFGDWFFVDPEGHVFMLDLLDGNLLEIALSVPEYNALKNIPDMQSEWFLDGFVFRCVAEGLKLKSGECYGWRVHPMMGAKMEFENIQVFSLRVYQSLMGQIFRQYKQLKPGDKIPPMQIT